MIIYGDTEKNELAMMPSIDHPPMTCALNICTDACSANKGWHSPLKTSKIVTFEG